MKYFCLFTFLFLNFTNQILAQSCLGYYFTPSEYSNYDEITEGTISSATGDDGGENINLPFPFKYLGVTYTTARISVNGWLEMGDTYTGTGAINELESTVKKPLICPLWDNLFADSQSEIRYETIGEYPARFFIVQWKNIILSSGYRKDFQVRLWELDGTIDFIYGSGPSYQNFSDNFSVGLNNHIGGPGNFISISIVDQYYYNIDTMIANNMNNDVSLLTNGMMFSFIPLYSGSRSALLYQTPDSVIVGNPNQKIFAIIIGCHAGGVLTPPWVTKFNFNTAGTSNTADIQNAKLFYTGSYPYFTTDIQLGSTYPNPDVIFEIGGFSNYLNNNGLSYYWLAYDISPNATIGNYIDANCFRVDFEGCCPSIIPDTTFAATRCIISNTGIQGNFTIGIGEDYENLFEALNFLKSNILVGQVTLDLTDSYNANNEAYPITIPKITNVSDINSVTIKTTSQNEIVFQSNNWSVFHFKESRYVTIDGYNHNSGQNEIKIVNNSPSGSAVYLSEGSSFNIVKNCELQAADTSADGSVIFFHELQYPLPLQGNQIQNCTVSRNSIGEVKNGILFKSGFSDHSKRKLSDWSDELSSIPNVIKDSKIKDFSFRGISVENNTNSFHLIGNSIFQTSESSSPIVEGIYFEYGAYPPGNADIISGNKIYNLQSKNITGNSITGIKMPGGFCVNTFNNFISLEGNELSKVFGIAFSSFGYYSVLNIHYNSVFISGINESDNISAAFYREGYNSSVALKNNLFINKRVSNTSNSKNYCVYLDNDYLIPDLDYNNYFYTSGTNNYLGRLEANNATTLNEWVNVTSRDFNSSFTDVSFISNIDLHLTGSSLGDTLLIATPLPELITDIDYELRNPLYPYKGADESIDYPLPVEFLSFTSSVVDNDVTLDWTTATEINNQGFQIEKRKMQEEISGDWRNIGFVNGNGTSTETQFFSFVDENLSSGKYQYRLKQIDFDGTFKYSNVIEVEINLPTKFSLEQNYPNPFNSTSKIKYSIPKSSQVSLKIFNTLGEEIETLVNEEKSIGTYELRWNAVNLPSGIYFYKLQAGDFVQTKKMILLK